jgi:hypothetical protein
MSLNENKCPNTGDMINNPSEEKNAKSGVKWRKIAMGAGVGILLGAVPTLVSGARASAPNAAAPAGAPNVDTDDVELDDATVSEEVDLTEDDLNEFATEVQENEVPAEEGASAWADEQAQVATAVNDDMSFSEAFMAARDEVGVGGAFEWQGNVYSTYTADEWDEQSEAEIEQYCSHFTTEEPENFDDIIDNELIGENTDDIVDLDSEMEVDVAEVIENLEPEFESDPEIVFPEFDEALALDEEVASEVSPELVDDIVEEAAESVAMEPQTNELAEEDLVDAEDIEVVADGVEELAEPVIEEPVAVEEVDMEVVDEAAIEEEPMLADEASLIDEVSAEIEDPELAELEIIGGDEQKYEFTGEVESQFDGMINTVEGRYEGESANFVDTDGDMIADRVELDLNRDGIIQHEEFVDISEDQISLDQDFTESEDEDFELSGGFVDYASL